MFYRFWNRLKKALCNFFEFCRDPVPDAIPTKNFDLDPGDEDQSCANKGVMFRSAKKPRSVLGKISA